MHVHTRIHVYMTSAVTIKGLTRRHDGPDRSVKAPAAVDKSSHVLANEWDRLSL